MEIKVIKEPTYQLKLSADEMGKLWKLVYDADYHMIDNARYFYNKFEDIRPAGGFKQE